jgi:hypothetical protein
MAYGESRIAAMMELQIYLFFVKMGRLGHK